VQLLGLLARVEGRRAVACDSVGDECTLTRDRIERLLVVREGVLIDRPAVATGEEQQRDDSDRPPVQGQCAESGRHSRRFHLGKPR
jgi:hypothetical protein